MRLQAHLLLMTLGTLLPMVVFGITATLLIANREEAVFRRGATERTLAVLTALDAELTGYASNLEVLAGSVSLEQDDLPAFYEEVARMLARQTRWRSVTLALPDGLRVMSTPGGSLSGALPPIVERASFEQVLRTRRPAIGSLVRDEGTYLFNVRVPVLAGDEVSYVLSALIEPSAIVELLTLQRLPSDWVGVVVDAEGRIVARTVDQEARVGQAASESLRAALDGGSEGWFLGSTLEGTAVYTPFNRSAFSGWTVAMGIPAATVEDVVSRTTWLLGSGISAAIALAFLLAAGLSRRIVEPISSLASVAKAIDSGGRIRAPPEASRVEEVNEVTGALVTAGKAAREREQALRSADQAKDEFLAMLAHELRNPLGALSSSVQVLQMTDSAEGVPRTATDVLQRQVQHMTRLVDDLLEVTRATAGKITLTRRAMNLADVVERFVDAQRASGVLDRHEVSVETSEVWADVDEARIEQILSNLIGNAVKFTPPGGRIDVRALRRGEMAVIEVADSGIGLTPELAPKVFDLFVQGEQSLDRSMGGLGIGLTLVKRLAEMQGGDARVASEGHGCGARFTVRLPAIEVPAEAPAQETSPAAVARARKLLLIEDNDDARLTLGAALALLGYAVTEAADGESALEAASEADYEVAVVDIGLPGLDGYEVARRLRAGAASGSAIVLVALSGYGDSESRRRALGAGFDVYFTKPIAPASLAQFIEAACENRDASLGGNA